ncbi:MAG TPA: carboxypeptidase-like regulatory domain-containing protein [Kofleriaceae bacterium]|nr:carboxypeptidase-like regulatory domain-containing protein [Kofleriaceae bacterium]
MLRYRELESSSLYAGLGVQLVDEFASVPAAGIEAPPLGWTQIDIDLDDGGVWRPVDPATLVASRSPAGIIWYPWLEHHADARGMAARNYRVRVGAEHYTPRYRYDAEGVTVTVSPYDDNNAPASIAASPTKITLLPASTYPFAPAVPVLRGIVVDSANAPVADAMVTWAYGTLQAESVLTDADGEFALPMRRAPLDTPIDVHAERPPPPGTGPSGDVIVRIPQDLSTFHTIQIS